MATTVKDIALAAGVSKAAVSKVLHNASTSVRVSAQTAENIRSIAERLGYVPNLNARSLRFAKTKTIGLYFDDLAGIAAGPLYTTHLLEGVCSVVFKRHYRVAIIAELEDEDATRSLGDGRLDGAIWCRLVRDRRTFDLMQSSPIPVVAMNAPHGPESEDGTYVRCDAAGGMEEAVDHLFKLGHRRILFLTETREVAASDRVDRLSGFVDAMARRGLTVGDEDILNWSWELEEFPQWWASHPAHTAIVGWSERCASRLLRQCSDSGVKVPEELSVVGFDSTQFCETTQPKLTAVRQPIIELAAQAASLLIDMIEGLPIQSEPQVFPCPLDVRESTASPRRLR